MPPSRTSTLVRVLALILVLGAGSGGRAGAQVLLPLAGPGEDLLRLKSLLPPEDSAGRSPARWTVFRRPSSLSPTPEDPSVGLSFLPLLPQLYLSWNSDLPFSRNDGTLWAGRGANVLLRSGFRIDEGPLSIILAPEFTYSENRGYQVFSSSVEGRSSFSSPWYTGLRSADLPSRFGNEPWSWFDFGQSSVTLRLWGAAVGAATENVWWGPGSRNGLVLSSHAPGFPHLFLRTDEAFETLFGKIRAHWILGGLVESLYFDTDGSNNLRSLAAAGVSFEPWGAPGLSLGLIRSVVAPVDGSGEIFTHALDPLFRWDRRPAPGAVPEELPDSDPLLSAFFRWAVPASGVEVWGEWARMDPPSSVEDLLAAPHRSQGYLLGLQWIRSLDGDDNRIRIQGEITSLEQTRADRSLPLPLDFYSGQAAPQGHTHRGQALGAGIGPGGSSQWLALDWLTAGWRSGLFVERIRWNNDALYRQTNANQNRHDVSIRLGIRGGLSLPHLELQWEMAGEQRYNYLFQNGFYNPGGYRTVDIRNYTLSFFAIPGGRR